MSDASACVLEPILTPSTTLEAGASVHAALHWGHSAGKGSVTGEKATSPAAFIGVELQIIVEIPLVRAE